MPRYLVVQLARFGDVIQTKRLILSLMQKHGAVEPEVHLCVDSSLAAIAGMVYPELVLHRIRAHAEHGVDPLNVLMQNKSAFAKLAAHDFDEVFVLNRSPMSFAIAGLFDPDRVRGYRLRRGQQEHSYWAALAARWTRDRRSAPLNLVDFWAYFTRNPILPSLVNPIARPAQSGSGAKQGRIGVVLAGRQSRRSLPPEELAKVIQSVFEARGGPEIILLGSKDERVLARKLLRNFNSPMLQRTHDHSGETALTDLPDLLQSLDLLLTPDTGTMHLGAHLGVPIMGFFLSSAWCFETGPYGLGHRVWQAAHPCAPCLESSVCQNELTCLAPFRHPGFLGHLAGKYSPEWPYALLGLASTLDDLGASYIIVDGEDPNAMQRMGLRTLVAEYLGLIPENTTAAELFSDANSLMPEEGSQKLAELSHNIFNESDWILPRYI